MKRYTFARHNWRLSSFLDGVRREPFLGAFLVSVLSTKFTQNDSF